MRVLSAALWIMLVFCGAALGRAASTLAAYLEEPGLEIQFLFRKVRDKMLKETGGMLEPFVYGSHGAELLYFAR
jgi:hypothetical protein